MFTMKITMLLLLIYSVTWPIPRSDVHPRTRHDSPSHAVAVVNGATLACIYPYSDRTAHCWSSYEHLASHLDTQLEHSVDHACECHGSSGKYEQK